MTGLFAEGYSPVPGLPCAIDLKYRYTILNEPTGIFFQRKEKHADASIFIWLPTLRSETDK
ncbi:MAG: hypothetical protein WB037_25420, partial [Pseudolabrys sp.]